MFKVPQPNPLFATLPNLSQPKLFTYTENNKSKLPPPLLPRFDSPIFSLNAPTKTQNPPFLFEKSKSAVFDLKMTPKQNPEEKTSPEWSLKLKKLETQLNKRIEDVKDTIEKKPENITKEIPKEYIEIENNFSLLHSWMKSVILNLTLKKSLREKKPDQAPQIETIKNKIKELRLNASLLKSFAQDMKAENKDSDISEAIRKKYEQKLSDFEKQIKFLNDYHLTFESFDKSKKEPRNLRYFL